MLPDGEDLNEWIAVNSKQINYGTPIYQICPFVHNCEWYKSKCVGKKAQHRQMLVTGLFHSNITRLISQSTVSTEKLRRVIALIVPGIK